MFFEKELLHCKKTILYTERYHCIAEKRYHFRGWKMILNTLSIFSQHSFSMNMTGEVLYNMFFSREQFSDLFLSGGTYLSSKLHF